MLGVEGSDLRDWNLAPAAPDGRQRIAVNLATPGARIQYRLRVTLEAPVAVLPAKLSVPDAWKIAHAEGQSGTITLTADPGAGRQRSNPRAGVDPTSGFAVTKPSGDARKEATGHDVFLGAYRFLRLPYARGPRRARRRAGRWTWTRARALHRGYRTSSIGPRP